jgi:cobalamin synthase
VIIITIWYLVTLLNGRIIELLPVIAGLFIVIAFSVLLIISLGWFFTRRIGGVTGDIVGGSSEIVEFFFLLMSYLVLNYLWY